MFSRIRRQINPATIMAFVALIFTMTGGAFAVTGHGGGSGGRGSHLTTASAGRAGSSNSMVAVAARKKSKPKGGARGPAGPKGATGATGPAGPAGPTGATGATGTGTPGVQGNEGKAGESVTNTAAKNCGPEGGAEFKVGGGAATKACNGKTGFTETLPPEKTETGAWSVSAAGGANESEPMSSISFTIPLAKPLSATAVHFVEGTEEIIVTYNVTMHTIEGEIKPATSCPGTVAEPAALPGDLCVYEGQEDGVRKFDGFPEGAIGPASGAGNLALLETHGASTAGALILMIREEEQSVFAAGTWAVTAEKE